MALLEAKELTKRFGGFVAVDNIDLSVERETIHSIIGPNGAGKTTLFNLFTGALPVTEGTILFKDEDITEEPEYERPYLGLSRSYQITNLYNSMTVLENIQTAVALYELNYYDLIRTLDSKSGITERAADLLTRLELGDKQDIEVSSLSHGDKRRLEIGMGLASNPDLLLLDEPTAGTDPSESADIASLIEELADDIAVVLVEHDIEHVMSISTKISVLERGSIIASGTADDIQSNQRVIDAYLGESVHA